VSENNWIDREPVLLDSLIVDIKDNDFYIRVRQDIYRVRGFKKMDNENSKRDLYLYISVYANIKLLRKEADYP
jgi:hypothetical protein